MSDHMSGTWSISCSDCSLGSIKIDDIFLSEKLLFRGTLPLPDKRSRLIFWIGELWGCFQIGVVLTEFGLLSPSDRLLFRGFSCDFFHLPPPMF